MCIWQVFEAMDGAPFNYRGKCYQIKCEETPEVGRIAPFTKGGKNVRVIKKEYDHDLTRAFGDSFYHVWIDWATPNANATPDYCANLGANIDSLPQKYTGGKKKYYRAFVKGEVRQMCDSIEELKRVIQKNRYVVEGEVEICHYYRIDSMYGEGKGHYGTNLEDATRTMGFKAIRSMTKILVEMEDGSYSEIPIPNLYRMTFLDWERFLKYN